MRSASGRNMVVGLGLAGLLAAGSAAQPPLPLPAPKPGDPPVLKKTADPPAVLPKVGDSSTSAERARLQGQLQELIKQLQKEPPTGPGFPVRPPSRPPGGLPPTGGGPPVDALRAAMNYFQDKDFEAAYRVARQIDLTTLGREDRAFANYLTGCSLRRLGRRSEAATYFREVAAAKDDEFLAECAIWQLSLIQSTRDIEAQLEQLRGRPKGP